MKSTNNLAPINLHELTLGTKNIKQNVDGRSNNHSQPKGNSFTVLSEIKIY